MNANSASMDSGINTLLMACWTEAHMRADSASRFCSENFSAQRVSA